MNKFLLEIIALILGYFSFYTIFYLTDISYYYLWSFIPAFLICLLIIPFIIHYHNKEVSYDGNIIFKSFFSKKYWSLASLELKKIKNIVMISILLALSVSSKLITLPSGFGDLGISFSYIFIAIGAMLYGPLAGLLMGFLADNIEFLVYPSAYPYFIGYTISSMLTGLICGLFFYRTKITFFKTFLSRLIINLFINAILGTVWMGIIADYTSFSMYLSRFLLIALPKNLVYLIPQSIVLYAVFKASAKVFVRANMLPLEIKDSISLF